jgi:hypothetical protein
MHPIPSSQRSLASSSRDAQSSAAPSGGVSSEEVRPTRELPDVTGFLIVVVVTVGLFIVPVGATLMQGPAIVASLFSGR